MKTPSNAVVGLVERVILIDASFSRSGLLQHVKITDTLRGPPVVAPASFEVDLGAIYGSITQS